MSHSQYTLMATSEQEKRDLSNAPGNHGVEWNLVRVINTATGKLEGLSPRARKMTRRGFLTLAGVTTLTVIGAAAYNEASGRYKKALADLGFLEVNPDAGGKWVELPRGKIIQESVLGNRHLYLLNFSRYEILYNKDALNWVSPYIDYPENAFVVRSNLIDSPSALKQEKVSSGEKQFMDLASEQEIRLMVRPSGRDIAIDQLMIKLRGGVDVSGLTDTEKDAFGILLGIHTTVSFVSRIKFPVLSFQLDSKTANLEDPEVQKGIVKKDAFEAELYLKLSTGKLKPWFRVSFK